MKRYVWLSVLVALGGVCWLLLGRSAQDESPRPQPERPAAAAHDSLPNILLISIDTVRADHLSCYGYARETTPALDGLAEEGILFENAITQAPWTLPSHMSLFTSQYPSYNGVRDISMGLADSKVTLAELLAQNGYFTAALVNNGQMKKHWGFDQGFRTWREFEVLDPNGRVCPEGTCENITKEACRWLEGRESAKDPFFLFLHYFDAHDPYDPPPPYDTQFRQGDEPSIRGEDTSDILYAHRPQDRNFQDQKLLEEIIALYDGELRRLDASLSQLFAQLAALGMAENTLVVVFSDHGEEFEEHLSTTHGATLYDECLKVVLLMRLPKRRPRGQRVRRQVSLLDVLPTILDVASLPPHEAAQGQSLLGAIRAKEPAAPPPLARSETTRVLDGLVRRSFRSGAAKYVYSLIDGKEELYELGADPGEQKNLVGSAPEGLAALRAQMRAWVNETEDSWRIRFWPAGQTCRFRGRLEAPDGRFGAVIPVGFGPECMFLNRDCNVVEFDLTAKSRPCGMYFEMLPPDSRIVCDIQVEGARKKRPIFVGADHSTPEQVPFPLDDAVKPIEPFFLAGQRESGTKGPGCYILRYRSAAKARASGAGRKATIDQRTKDQLRSLGYVR